jgi:hypothetical protein
VLEDSLWEPVVGLLVVGAAQSPRVVVDQLLLAQCLVLRGLTGASGGNFLLW